VSRETRILNPDSKAAPADRPSPAPDADPGPFDWLPRLGMSQVRLERRLRNWNPEGKLNHSLGWLEHGLGAAVRIERTEVLWRASGMGRPGLIVQLTVPRFGTRVALGIETPLAHHVVDRLLGFDRPFAESRLQITPVEWGIWSFLVLRALDSLHAESASRLDHHGDPGLMGPGDLTLDRVGPDAFDATGLGSIVTIRWAVHVGDLTGAVRIWVPESIVQLWLASPATAMAEESHSDVETRTPDPQAAPNGTVSRGELSGAWRALAGFVSMPMGLRRLRIGGVLPLTETRLIGSPRNPSGPVDLIVDLDGQGPRFRISTRPVADSGGRLLRVEAAMLQERRPRDPIFATKLSRTPMSQPFASQDTAAPQGVAPLDVPVTLIVELGRVNLTLTQLASLKPGDVVELGRHSRAPVELTSGGRLVARGELVQIDTDLGVRVTNVFL
jgi:flagellar motor switch/type III secretory pathway protein FliN